MEERTLKTEALAGDLTRQDYSFTAAANQNRLALGGRFVPLNQTCHPVEMILPCCFITE